MPFTLQADSQLQEQLFKLYHNERDIEALTDELKGKQKELERMVDWEEGREGRKEEPTSLSMQYIIRVLQV